MANHDRSYPASGWEWISATDIEIGGCLMFVKGVSPQRVIEAFGMNPNEARQLPASQVEESLPLPVVDSGSRTVHPWVRAGQLDGWAFAFDQSALDITGYHQHIARELSAGTELAMFVWTQTVDYFHYLVDGSEVTAFDPIMPQDRSGTEPDRFLQEMRRCGLEPDPSSEEDPDSDLDPSIAVLEMLTLAFGIRLPSSVALGPLLTAQRNAPLDSH